MFKCVILQYWKGKNLVFNKTRLPITKTCIHIIKHIYFYMYTHTSTYGNLYTYICTKIPTKLVPMIAIIFSSSYRFKVINAAYVVYNYSTSTLMHKNTQALVSKHLLLYFFVKLLNKTLKLWLQFLESIQSKLLQVMWNVL